MTSLHPDERASRIQTETVFRLVGSWRQALRPAPKLRETPRTLLEAEISAWVNEGGGSDDGG